MREEDRTPRQAEGGSEEGAAPGSSEAAGSAEDRLTGWLRQRLGTGNLLGNDAAVLPELAAGARWVATVDSQIAGVHYPEGLDPALAARRLLAVNLSDAAAMGAEPGHALLALSGPPRLDRRRYLDGLITACEEHGVVLAGGDLARTTGLVIGTLTLLAELPAGRSPLLRSSARPGHDLWIGGSLGEAAAGLALLQRGATVEASDEGAEATAWRVALPQAVPAELAEAARRAVWRHLSPRPQLALGRGLAAAGAAGAAIDVSDGLALDLSRLCRASAVGAEVDSAALPRSPAFAELCAQLDLDPLDTALGGGEDYVLLFTLPADQAPPGGVSSRRIGRIRAEPGLLLRDGGTSRPLDAVGWDHLT